MSRKLVGAPLFVGRPNLGRSEDILASIETILDSRWLSNQGPFVEEFERRSRELLRRLGVEIVYAICQLEALNADGRRNDRTAACHRFEHFESRAAADAQGNHVNAGFMDIGPHIVHESGKAPRITVLGRALNQSLRRTPPDD